MLFEPGTVISACTGSKSGTISMRSGSAISQIYHFCPSPQLSLGRARGILRMPGVAPMLGLLEKFFDRPDVVVFEGQRKFLQILDEHAEHARQILSIGQRDVAPHLGRARGNARRVAKTVGAK